jgi:hypothetical protein
MDPAEFAAKWKGSTLTERGAALSHFSDLCHMLDAHNPDGRSNRDVVRLSTSSAADPRPHPTESLARRAEMRPPSGSTRAWTRWHIETVRMARAPTHRALCHEP